MGESQTENGKLIQESTHERVNEPLNDPNDPIPSPVELRCNSKFQFRIEFQELVLVCNKYKNHPGVHGTTTVSEGSTKRTDSLGNPNKSYNTDAGKKVHLTWPR